MNFQNLTPSQVRNLIQRATDPLTVRSLVKLEDALLTGDDMLRIEAEDELSDVFIPAEE